MKTIIKKACLLNLVLVSYLGLNGCVSQGTYDSVVKERDDLEKQNRALQANVKLSRNQEMAVSQESQKLKENLETTTQELATTHEKLAITTQKAVSASTLYSKLVDKLASEVQSQQITIKQMQSGVNLNLAENILFESGSADVSTSGQKVLDKVAKELGDIPYQTIVGGFTDNIPISPRLATEFPTNWDLAAARATKVVRLLEESGIPKERLVAVSFGENQPVAPNEDKEGRSQNRRIEIRLRPVIVE